MVFDPQNSIFYVTGVDQTVVGAGFCLSPTLAVTTASVVAAAGGAPGGILSLHFLLDPKMKTAQILTTGWSAPDKSDLAYLRLESSVESYLPLGFSDESGGRACSYLVLEGNTQVRWQPGIIAGVISLSTLPEPLLDIYQDGEQTGLLGSPVLESYTGMVVGILRPLAITPQNGLDARHTCAELADTLQVYWPDLKLSHLPYDLAMPSSQSPSLFFQTNPGSQTPELKHLIGRQVERRGLENLYSAALQKKKPLLAFLTGIFGSGTKALGRAFLEANQEKSFVLFTRFWPLQDALENILQDARWSIEIKACSPYLENARFLNLPEYVGLLPIFAQAFRQKLLSSDSLAELKSLDQVLPLLSDLFNKNRPVVLLLEDIEYAGIPWLVWMKALAQSGTKGMGGLILATLHSPQPVANLDTSARSIAQALAVELTAKGLAESIYLGPIQAVDIVNYLGRAQPMLAVQIQSLSRGVPLLADNLWESLNSRGHVNQRFDGSWELDGRSVWLKRRTAHDYINEILTELYDQPDPPPWSRETMLSLLACGAQEGPIFTAEALALTFQIELEDLLAAFDYILDAEFEDGYVQTGLIIDITSMKLTLPSVGWQASLHRFRFQPLFVWLSLYEDNCPESDLLKRFADSLLQVNWPFAGRVAGTLSQLYRRAGNTSEAARYQALSQAGDHISTLRAEIELLENAKISVLALDLNAQFRQRARLLDLYQMMLNDGVMGGMKQDALRQVAEKVQALAQALGRKEAQLYAEFQLAELDNQNGRASSAGRTYERLIPIYETNGQEDFLLICLLRLGEINLQQHRPKKARELLDRVLDLASEHENDQAAAMALKGLAAVDFEQGQFEKAIEGYTQAIELFEEAGLANMVQICQAELKKVRKGKR